MSFKIPSQFPVEKTDIVFTFHNQTFIHFHRKKECFKRPVELEQHLIMVVLKGKKVMISTEQDITVHKNEVLFLQKGTYLTSEKILEEGEFSSLLFFIREDLLNQFKEKYDRYLKTTENTITPKMFKVDHSPILNTYVNSLLAYFENHQNLTQPLLQLKIEEILLSLLFSDEKRQFHTYLLSLGNTANTSFKETIEKSIFKNLTVAERAFLSNLSVSSFKRKFKEVFDDSPAHWLREQRLRRAKVLLNSTDKNIAEISYEVGFESPSHFIHIFKKKYGTTPKKLMTK